MPSKKDNTKKGAAKKSAAPVSHLTLDVTIRGHLEKPDEFYVWETDGFVYSEMLGSPECPEAFRKAFNSLFVDHLLAKCDVTHPCNISAFFPLVMLVLQDGYPCDSEAIADALRTLREELAPELTEKVLAGMEGKGARGNE